MYLHLEYHLERGDRRSQQDTISKLISLLDLTNCFFKVIKDFVGGVSEVITTPLGS